MGRAERNHGIGKSGDKRQAPKMDEVLGKQARKAKGSRKKESSSKEGRRKKTVRKAGPLTKVLAALLILGILAGGGSLAWQFLHSGFGGGLISFGKSSQEFDDGEVTILMLGSDERELEEASRADTIMVGRFNFKEGWVRIISIPRDTRVKIPGYKDNKINAAYALGGEPLLEETIEGFYDIEIDRYMAINFFTFQEAVEKLGGVTVVMDKPLKDKDWGLDLQAGPNLLTGEVALNFVRFRGTPTADLGRIGRQQLFIKALASDIKNKANVFEQADIISGMFSELSTNLSLNELFYMFNSYKKLDDFHISTWMSAGKTDMIDGVSYVIPTSGIAKDAQGFLNGELVVLADEEGGIFPELVSLKEKAEADREAAEKAAEEFRKGSST